MQSLPATMKPYKKTPLFGAGTVPAGLLKSHNTKEGVWAKIVVTEGALIYRILEPVVEEVRLRPGICGVVEPTVKHEVVPSQGVQFYVEFYR